MPQQSKRTRKPTSHEEVLFPHPYYPDDPDQRLTLEQVLSVKALDDYHCTRHEEDLRVLGSLLRAVAHCAEAVDAERHKLVSAPKDYGFPSDSTDRFIEMLDALNSFAQAVKDKRDALAESFHTEEADAA